jgi:hypothetical protein
VTGPSDCSGPLQAAIERQFRDLLATTQAPPELLLDAGLAGLKRSVPSQ